MFGDYVGYDILHTERYIYPNCFFLPDFQSATSYTSINSGGQSSPQVQYYGSRRSSVHSNTEPQEVADANVKFVRDTSRIWYKPNISREQGKFRARVPNFLPFPLSTKSFILFRLYYTIMFFHVGEDAPDILEVTCLKV